MRRGRSTIGLLTLSLLWLNAWAARADVFHLKSGGAVEGDLISKDETTYTIRAAVGTVSIARDAVARIEKAPSLFDEYARRAAAIEPNARSHFQLAQWCAEKNLFTQRKSHLNEAIKLDPDFAPARKALGYVKVGRAWVDGSARRDAARPTPDNPEEQSPELGPKDRDKALRLVQAHWTRRIRAIRQNLLEAHSQNLVEKGLARIRAIDDPKAILPLSRELGASNLAARTVLVELLSGFEHDEATVNLAALALIDNDGALRHRAILELQRRDDPRVLAQFRTALQTGNDVIVIRAAYALATMKDENAIPLLINQLMVRRRKVVEIPIRRYFTTFTDGYARPFTDADRRHWQPVNGILDAHGGFAQVESRLERRMVTVFRTEVLEALKKLTGENFGFNELAWNRWYQEKSL